MQSKDRERRVADRQDHSKPLFVSQDDGGGEEADENKNISSESDYIGDYHIEVAVMAISYSVQ